MRLECPTEGQLIADPSELVRGVYWRGECPECGDAVTITDGVVRHE